VAVVIPARDRADALAACLARLGEAGDVVVVDDGSLDPGALAAVAREGGARVVRRASSGGPAAARNAGLRATSLPLVAFVDSDTLPVGDWLEPLLRHFGDAGVGAVAPRIRVPAGAGAVTAYEAARSPLDLGPAPGTVAPGHRISFVPSATLVVRRDAAGTGFDEGMRFGEDVDLVWRLGAAGWAVRYEPACVVEHPHRSGGRAWLAQRVAYGSSAGALAARHPGKLRHVVVPTWAIAPWALGLAGRPALALAAAATGTALVVARLPELPGVRREVALLAAGAHGRVARHAFDACWRAYPPLLAAGLATRRGRRVVAGGLALSVALEWRERRPRLDPLRFGALRVADDLAYATGVWLGCARARRLGPLVPALARGPKLSRRDER
jgi:mycofactocin system glycosyltransferase